MNIQPGKLKRQRKNTQNAASVLGARLGAVIKFALFLGVIAAFLNIYIYLNQKISETDLAIRETGSRIDRTEREIAQLRIQREELSRWEYIRAKINQFQLGLREPAPGQVGRMALLSPRQAELVPLEVVATTAVPARSNGRN